MATVLQCAGAELAEARWESPRILRIDRYNLRPGTETAVRNLQKQIAITMVRLGGTHPCLAVESLRGPKEIWCLTGFQSHTDQKRLAEAMEFNEVLRTALDRIQGQLQVLTGSPVTEVAHLQEEQGTRWRMGYGHFLAVSEAEGSVYTTTGGMRYGISATRTRREAECRAAETPSGRVFSVRAAWGMPAWQWVTRDQEFWASSPVFKQGAPRTSQFRKLTTFAG